MEQNNDPYWGQNSDSGNRNSNSNPLSWNWHDRNFHNNFVFPTFEDFSRLINFSTSNTVLGDDDDYHSFVLDGDDDDEDDEDDDGSFISYEEEEVDDDEGSNYTLSFGGFLATTREIINDRRREGDGSFTMDLYIYDFFDASYFPIYHCYNYNFFYYYSTY